MDGVTKVDSRPLQDHSSADTADDVPFMIDIDDEMWRCCPSSPPSQSSDAAEMARAEEKGPMALQRLPTSTEPSADAQPLQQHNEGIWPVDTLLAHHYPVFINPDLLHSGPYLDLDLSLPTLRTYASAPDEDGGGSMVVVSSAEHVHHVIAHNDASDATLSSAVAVSDPRFPDMAAATTDNAAPAMPLLTGGEAPGAMPDHAMMDAHAHAHADALGNGLPLLDAPIDFAQAGALNGAADLDSMPMDMAHDFAPMDPFPPPVSNERVNAFARLRFDDGSYYMHTYQITLGRNIDLAHRDMKRLIKAEQLQAQGQPQAAAAYLNGNKDKKRKRDRRGTRSVISEKGGIVSAPIESMPVAYQQRRQSNASHSLSAVSHPQAETGEEKPAERAPQDMIMQAFPEVPAQFDGQVPEDPNDCPFVPIHPQQIMAKTGSLGPKGISREHAKIFFDYNEGHFCIEVLGNNGMYHEGEFYTRGAVVPLDHGDHLLIGAVNIHFYLPDVALTEEQRHRQESGSRPMSFAFENGDGQPESDELVSSESEEQPGVNPRHVYYHYPLSDELEDDAGGDDDMDDYYEEPVAKPRHKPALKLKLKNIPPSPPPKESRESKESKKAHKRKHRHRELTPEEPPPKKAKVKNKEPIRESVKEQKIPKERKEKHPKEHKEKESKEPKEPKEKELPREPKEKGKAPAKAPAKTPVKDETPVEEPAKEAPIVEKIEKIDKPEMPNKPIPNDSPPLLRKPLEGELEAGDIEGLITEEMAAQHNLPRTLIGQVVEKRKGPGRPPKDGIMSKRQRSQLIKQAKEIEKARAAGIDPADIPAPTIKPKAPKRKESNAAEGEDDGIMETTEQGDGSLSALQRQAKPIRPPRTPSPEMRIEDYTEEQLTRPGANYVVLIHEAISSAPSGQMNLQQIYTYIERTYPWYKFKTTTSGWQSSVRHNLGQHDAFVKGDKEGKGFNWRINPEVSIEKERRKRQVSPPPNNAQRPPFYPPQNGYQPYPPSGYPYPGMPHNMPQLPPRLPPSLAQPRLPPSMARNEGNTAAPTAPQGAPHPSPYASPWGGGAAAGSPPAPNPPRPYPQPNSQTPPVSSAAGPSGQYGVLYPTAAPQPSPYGNSSAPSPYGGPYGNNSASPYGPAPPRPYPTYNPGQQSNAPPVPPARSSASPYPPPLAQAQAHQGPPNEGPPVHPSGRYPRNTHSDLIRQLEAFRKVYLDNLPSDETKVDNAIRACVDATVPEATLTKAERELIGFICGLPNITKYLNRIPAIKPEDMPTKNAAGTAASIAADAAANTAVNDSQPASTPAPAQQPAPQTKSASPAPPQQGNSEPQRFTPNMTGAQPAASSTAPAAPSASASAPAPAHSLPTSQHRPSVEPLTPVPGSPAVPNQNGTPLKREITELNANSTAAANTDEAKRTETETGDGVPKTDE